MNNMKQNNVLNIPTWMKIDSRPLDVGEWQEYGFGYSRIVNEEEVWREVTRYFVRKDTRKLCNYKEVSIMPGLYYVSDHGRLFNVATGNFLADNNNNCRRKVSVLNADGKYMNARVYKLALDNFIEPTQLFNNLVRYLCNTVNHKNGDASCDRLDNLQYTKRDINTEHQAKVQRTLSGTQWVLSSMRQVRM